MGSGWGSAVIPVQTPRVLVLLHRLHHPVASNRSLMCPMMWAVQPMRSDTALSSRYLRDQLPLTNITLNHTTHYRLPTINHTPTLPETNGALKMNGMATKKAAPSRAPVKRATPKPAQKARPVQNKAASVAGGDNYAQGVGGAYAIMASRIANRVAEMAESITFVER
jgi:septal ring-binding cell division protein DamX